MIRIAAISDLFGFNRPCTILLCLEGPDSYNFSGQSSANQRRLLNNQLHISMRHTQISTIAVLVGLAAPLASNASSVLQTAHVLAVGTYGNGNVYITLDQPLDQSGCPGPYIELPANSPGLKNALAVATLAKTTGAAVTVATDGCFSSNTSTFTGARAGAFGLSTY